MATAYLLILMFLAIPVIDAENHDVGGQAGWSENTDFTAWASGQIFTKGDKLVFLYNSHHKVAIVTEDDYNSCNSASPLKLYTNGMTTITLKKEGPMFFIDPTDEQCKAGMKLAINVLAKGQNTTPSVPNSNYPTMPIGHLIPEPKGECARSMSNGLASGFSLLVILFMT